MELWTVTMKRNARLGDLTFGPEPKRRATQRALSLEYLHHARYVEDEAKREYVIDATAYYSDDKPKPPRNR